MNNEVPRKALLGVMLLILLSSLYAQNGNILKNKYAIEGGEIYTVPTGKTFLLHGVSLGGFLLIDGDTVAYSNVTSYLPFNPPMQFSENTVFSVTSSSIFSWATVYGYESPVMGGDDHNAMPMEAPLLGQNAPNPWSSSTSIEYVIPNNGRVALRVYDEVGRSVTSIVDGTLRPGRYCATWDGTDDEGRRVGAGTYFYVLSVDGKEITRKTLRLQ